MPPAPQSGSSPVLPSGSRRSTEPPSYAAITVGNSVRHAEMVAMPELGAVQRNQTDEPPGSPPWVGSPGSLVAPALVPSARIWPSPVNA